ncbi:hypothetical protein K0W35_004734 [Vibrio parahaemolyticus]|nr:hypothetical protein [Vibrio parahaemolyticus]
MKLGLTGLFLLVLVGCAQQPQSEELVVQVDKVPSCVSQLSQLPAAPNTYVRAFQACEERISDEVLVRRYVYALMISGQYQTLLDGTEFSEYVDAELAQYWTNWVKERLQ